MERAFELASGLALASVAFALRPVAPPLAPPRPEPGLRASAPPVASYTLEATLDPVHHAVKGKGTLRFTNVSARPLHELWFHRYLDAWRSRETRFAKGPGGFRGTGPRGTGRIDVERLALRGAALELRSADPSGEDGTDAVATLPAPIAPGETVEVELAWTSHLPPVDLRTGFEGSFHMVAQWFPKLAKLEQDGTFRHFPFERRAEFYADFGTYDVTIRVPEPFVVAATGHEERALRDGGERVYRFREENVHDFAFAAWDRFVVKERDAGPVRLRCFFPPGFARVAERTLDAAVFSLAHFGKRYGAYPYRDLTLVQPPRAAVEAGGMEYPTLVTTGVPWEEGAMPWRALEWLVVHEVGHQWFQGMVATDEAAHPFLDEGLTSYATAEALRSGWGSSSFAAAPLLPLSVEALERVGSLLGSSSSGPLDQPAATAPGLASIAYFRPELLFTSLERTYGPALGDALGDYARAERFRHPGPDALLAALARHLPPDGVAAARAAFETSSHVDYSVRSASCDGRSCRAGVARSGPAALPVVVRFTFADGATRSVVWDAKGTEGGVEVGAGESALAAVEIDPDQRVLLDVDRSNDAWSPRSRVPLRTTLLFGYAAQVAARLVFP